MEAGIPNLLIRTVSDPIESPFAQPPSQPDQDLCSALSFWKPVHGGGGSTSPLSQSPRPLQLELKERKETSSKAARPSSRSMLQDWAVGEEEKKKKGAEERERLLSLGIWSNLGQGGGLDGGEKREGGGAFGLGSAPVGVSQG